MMRKICFILLPFDLWRMHGKGISSNAILSTLFSSSLNHARVVSSDIVSFSCLKRLLICFKREPKRNTKWYFFPGNGKWVTDRQTKTPRGARRQTLTRKGAASRSARLPSASPGWSRRSRCCPGGARWSTRSWRGRCCGSRGGAAGARWRRSPWKIPVWLDQQTNYQWSIRHWSWEERKSGMDYHAIFPGANLIPGKCLTEIRNSERPILHQWHYILRLNYIFFIRNLKRSQNFFSCYKKHKMDKRKIEITPDFTFGPFLKKSSSRK